MPLPWSAILTHGPTIVDAARALYGMARRQAAESGTRPGSTDSLQEALATLQQREAQQAALVADLARQIQELAAALETIQARVRLALIGAGVAAALSLVALAVAIWRAG